MFLWLALLVTGVVANDNLRVAYQWKQMDFEFPNIDERQAAITNLTFVSENVIPVGLEVYKNRLFITLPRWKKGVPASLAYIDLNGEKKIFISGPNARSARFNVSNCNMFSLSLSSFASTATHRTTEKAFLCVPSGSHLCALV
jgi:hypothetical protein